MIRSTPSRCRSGRRCRRPDRGGIGSDVRRARAGGEGVAVVVAVDQAVVVEIVGAVRGRERSRRLIGDGDGIGLGGVVPVPGVGPAALVVGGLVPLVLAREEARRAGVAGDAVAVGGRGRAAGEGVRPGLGVAVPCPLWSQLAKRIESYQETNLTGLFSRPGVTLYQRPLALPGLLSIPKLFMPCLYSPSVLARSGPSR